MNAPANETYVGSWRRRARRALCLCRSVAMAAGAERSVIDCALCRSVLQRRWRITCDHLSPYPKEWVKGVLPPYDSDNPLDTLLIANADITAD